MSLTNRSLHPPTSILKVYREALHGFGHIHHPSGLNNTSIPQGCVFENDSSCENCGANLHLKDRKGGEEPVIAYV